ncbi:hypothetical protein OH687_13465 [Burkholderia anthina]|nr:hypothetical protein OH687_13465 [Burkholderia anthina]
MTGRRRRALLSAVVTAREWTWKVQSWITPCDADRAARGARIDRQGSIPR